MHLRKRLGATVSAGSIVSSLDCYVEAVDAGPISKLKKSEISPC